MVVAAAEPVLNLGLIVAVSAGTPRSTWTVAHVGSGLADGGPRVDRALLADGGRGHGCLLGERITRYTAGPARRPAPRSSRSSGVAIFIDFLGQDPDDRSVLTSAWAWLTAGTFRVDASS